MIGNPLVNKFVSCKAVFNFLCDNDEDSVNAFLSNFGANKGHLLDFFNMCLIKNVASSLSVNLDNSLYNFLASGDSFVFITFFGRGAGGDESGFFLSDYQKYIETYLAKVLDLCTPLSEDKTHGVYSFNPRNIDFESFVSLVMLLHEGPNIRVQRTPANSTRIHTSTIRAGFKVLSMKNNISSIVEYFSSDEMIVWEAFRSSGAGGQHVNKVNTAVRLRHKKLDYTIVATDERSQVMNKKIAKERLKSMLKADFYNLLHSLLFSETTSTNRNEKNMTYNFKRNEITYEDGIVVPFERVDGKTLDVCVFEKRFEAFMKSLS